MLNEDQIKINFARDDDKEFQIEEFEADVATYQSLTIFYINES